MPSFWGRSGGDSGQNRRAGGGSPGDGAWHADCVPPAMSLDIDPRALGRLMDAGGFGLLQRMVALFLKNTPERIASLRAGLDGGDWSVVELAAHSMKSSAAHLGLEGLRAEASRIEELASQGSADGLRPRIDHLALSFPSARELLIRTLDQLR